MPVLIAATVASENPTDGYLVKDIISILHMIHVVVVIRICCNKQHLCNRYMNAL